jgi:hypothetical protein
MTDALTTASHKSGRASTKGQLNTKEWGKLVWAVPPPSHAPLQAQYTNFLLKPALALKSFGTLYEIWGSHSSMIISFLGCDTI